MPSSQQLQALAERHLARLARRVRQRAAQSRQLSYIRLGLFLGSVLLATVAYQSGYQVVGAALLAVGLSGFAVAAHRHSKVERSIRRYRRWMEIKQAHLARMRHDWENIPLPPTLPPTEGHPFETDLNITGPRSLLHLIDTSVSAEGSNRLRQWLLQREANPGLIRSRATLVRQLLPRSLFRDRLALAGALAARKQEERWTGAEFMAWLQAHANQQSLFPWLVALLLLAGTTLLLLLLALLNVLPAAWPFSLGVYALLYIARGKDYRELYSDALDLEVHLHRFGAVLLHLERFGYAGAPDLAKLCQPFRDPARRPSARLRGVGRIIAAASVQGNPLARLLFNIVVPWDYWFAWRLAQEQKKIREEVPVWLDCWHELEALCSLANLADLNPEFTFPEVAETAANGQQSPLLQAVQIGHPLLGTDARVANDYHIERPGTLAIVTGSNMSGKSTMLRTLGANLVLAYAGGPVCAQRLRVAPMRLFTCINVTDSVNDGISYFYAEVRRLRDLLAALRQPHNQPLFFLIDEIFRGTNNRERLIGSRSYVRALAGGNGAGLISTHDLELVHLADELASISNLHFREEIHNGRMTFDYRLRPGPCPTTNALEIMRMEGLPVEGK
ncbi:MAG: hypothetical protein IPM61_07870 [Chlorobi bacterium]|nr:hypothetical protein [Chlorobiota bacterium]MCE7933956.1 hypothetical protein [Chlorobi bacterium CHB2]